MSLSPVFEELRRQLERRILVLDGAMGTMIQRYGLSEEDFRGARLRDHPKDVQGNNDLLILTRPDVIREIHEQYLAAGADIIETNTFSSTSIVQADYALEALAYELNFEGARIARAACDKWSTPDRRRFVAGAIGPANRTLSISPDVNDPSFRATTFDALREAYEEQVRGLVEGGADVLLLETIFDTLNAKAGIFAIENVFAKTGVRLPVMISFTITDKSGRTLSGQTLEAFYISIRHAHPFSIGINCALGARDMRPYLADLARIAECYVSSYPNAGLPNAFGQYDELPDETAGLVRDFATSGLVNIVGGCCGTTPDHIREIARGGRDRATALRVRGTGTRIRTRVADLAPTRHRLHATVRPRTPRHSSGQQLPDGRRADQRDRLAAVRAVDQGGQLRRGDARRARPGARRRQHHRREHGRRHARLRACDDDVPELHRDRARDRPRAGDDRQLEVDGARGGPEVRAGQGGRQLDQPEGRRGRLPREGAPGSSLRRRRGRHGLRRDRSGGHDRAQGRRSASAPTSC